jgi:hypothetical protein
MILKWLKLTLKWIGIFKPFKWIHEKTKYLRYIIISNISPVLSHQVRFLPLSRINRLIFIDIHNINEWVWYEKNENPGAMSNGFNLKGDWDNDKKPVFPDLMNSSPTFRSTYQLFVNKVDYTECDQYMIMRNMLETTGSTGVWGHCKTDYEIDEYFKNIIAAYHSIKNNGYKTQKELGGTVTDEIRVVIDRYGNFVKFGGGGNHRFPIAKILNLQSVPVYVVGAHYEWIKKCYQRYNSDIVYSINKGLSMLESRGRSG